MATDDQIRHEFFNISRRSGRRSFPRRTSARTWVFAISRSSTSAKSSRRSWDVIQRAPRLSVVIPSRISLLS